MDCFASLAMTEASTYNPYRQRADAADEIRIEALWRAGDFKAKVAVQYFLPENAYLLLGEAVADAAMDAGAESEMLPGLGAVDNELVGTIDLALVAIAGDVPHHHLVAFGDVAARQFDIVTCGAAHVQHRCVIADDFGNEIRDQFAPRADQPELLGVFDQRHQPAAHRIARGVVAADDQKRDRTDEFALLQVARGFGMRQHRDQVEGPRRIGARFPQFAEIFAHLDQLIETFGFRMHDGIRRVDISDRDIGPPGQLDSIFPGKIEQGR